MPAVFNLLAVDGDIEAEMLKETTTNPTIHDLAEQVRLAVMDGLGSDQASYQIAEVRALIVQREIARALLRFNLKAATKAVKMEVRDAQ